ncbi:MAG TPA: hypothetical protein VMV18_00860, partial [bacterium]|nr:hypothetical protein [bacterium]
FWAVLEEDGKHRGAGAYVLRVGPPAADSVERILEAPHVFHDLRTDEIAVPLFFDPPRAKPRALFVNTIHRYQDSKDARDRTYANPADVCHNPDHVFTTATLAAAEALGKVQVVELHGYSVDDPEARGSALPKGTSMVVSGGVESGATPLSRAVAAALKKDFDAHVLLYPDDTKTLGATTNVQMLGLKRLSGAEFLHIEMARTTRDDLATDAARRTAFGRIVLK